MFKARTGRQARYHVAIEETPEWAYLGEPLPPLKGFPGVVWDIEAQAARYTNVHNLDGFFGFVGHGPTRNGKIRLRNRRLSVTRVPRLSTISLPIRRSTTRWVESST
jgi:hypothetical protein